MSTVVKQVLSCVRCQARLGALALALLSAAGVRAENAWTGGGDTTNWFDAANWSAGVPVAGQAVTVGAGALMLTNATPELASFTMTGGKLTFLGWETALKATEMSLGATVTHAANTTNAPDPETGEWVPQHRIWLQGSNITVTATGKLDADIMGYRLNAGPGRATTSSGGAGHAHEGGRAAQYNSGGPSYGDPAAPWQPGSSGGTAYRGGTGGGSIRIEAAGKLIIDGTLTANATYGVYPHGPGGSGGSIWLTCRTFSGAATGLVSAQGSSGYPKGSGAGGSGGRIALHYDPTAQAALAAPSPPVRFDATPGTPARSDTTPYMGTLYLPDTLFLAENLSDRQFWNTEIVIPGFTNWSPSALALNNCSFGLPLGFVLKVTNNLTLANGAALSVRADPVADPKTDAGTRIEVGGSLILSDGAWIYPYANDTNGATANLIIEDDLLVDATSGIDADYKGYRRGYGPGRSSATTGIRQGGGGYGGAGSQGEGSFGGPAYGDPTQACQAGSGGSAAPTSGNGGGAIRLSVGGNAVIDGTLTARGAAGVYQGGAGGAGGGISLTCDTLQGSGLIRVDGGAANETAGCGGGGRIAVHYDSVMQAAVPVPTVKFSAYAPPVAFTYNEEMGTLYLPDTRFLAETLSGQRFWHTRLVIPGWVSWHPASLKLDGCAISLPTGFDLAVSGDLVLTNNARLHLKAAFTNSPAERYGQTLQIGGDLYVGSGCWIQPDADQTNGAIVRIRVAGDALIAATGGIQADGEGYLPRSGNLNGPGAGKNSNSGGGYGGIGGYTADGIAYGLPEALPRHPGSPAGYNSHIAGGGGGAIQLIAGGTVTLDGTLSANGRNGQWQGGAGGSGGAILVAGRRVTGAGTLVANGGNGTDSKGAGGGGRIAVWHKIDLDKFEERYDNLDLQGVVTNVPPAMFHGTASALSGTAGAAGGPGTVMFCVPPPGGTLLLLH